MNNSIDFKSDLDSGYDAVKIYQDKAACADLGQETCPYCGNTGCIRHGYYARQCKDVSNGVIVSRPFRMLRAKCRRCGRTHAVRFGIFSRFRQYSNAFIQEICAASRLLSASIRKVCDSIPVCPRTLSRWKTRCPLSRQGSHISDAGRDPAVFTTGLAI